MQEFNNEQLEAKVKNKESSVADFQLTTPLITSQPLKAILRPLA